MDFDLNCILFLFLIFSLKLLNWTASIPLLPITQVFGRTLPHCGSFEKFVISHIWGYLMTGIIDQSANEMRSISRVQEKD